MHPPSMHSLIQKFANHPAWLVKSVAKNLLANGCDAGSLDEQIHAALNDFAAEQLRPLHNATGVILHTNLGRALVSEQHARDLARLISAPVNLELSMRTGGRGVRDERLRSLLALLFGCEDALVVNNNAAAVYLVLNSLARGRRVVCAKSECVEIGGGFRISEVAAASGAQLIEVGASNKVNASDYERAFGGGCEGGGCESVGAGARATSTAQFEAAVPGQERAPRQNLFSARKPAPSENLLFSHFLPAPKTGAIAAGERPIYNSNARANSEQVQINDEFLQNYLKNLENYYQSTQEKPTLLLKTHKSNFFIGGFSAEVAPQDCAKIAHSHGALCYYDLGSAHCGVLPQALREGEPSAAELLAAGVDVLSFSGDKLFASTQAGIILAPRRIIARLRANHLFRMFRPDKTTLILLELAARSYLDGRAAELPSLRLLNESKAQRFERASRIKAALGAAGERLQIEPSRALVGGGSMPDKSLPSAILRLGCASNAAAEQALESLREAGIIAVPLPAAVGFDVAALHDEQGFCAVLSSWLAGR